MDRENGVFCKEAESKNYCPAHGSFPGEWFRAIVHFHQKVKRDEYVRARETGCFRQETNVVKVTQRK